MTRANVKRIAWAVTVCAAAWLGRADELDVARSALRDGLWEIARAHAAKVEGSSEARLVTVESYAREGKWDDVLKTLDSLPDETGEGFIYYRALALSRTDQAAAAAKLLAEKSFADEAYVKSALVLQAELARRDKAADRVLKLAAEPAFPTNDVAALSLVAWAKATSGDADGASAIWRRIVADPAAAEGAVAAAATSLGDIASLRAAHARMASAELKRSVGLRLGCALLATADTFDEGARLIRALAKDSPDADGACAAFLKLADATLKKGDGKEATDLYRKALEAWPETAKDLAVQEGYAWALRQENRLEEAFAAFARAEGVAVVPEDRARALMAQGEVLTALGRGEEAMAKYRVLLEKYPDTPTGKKLKVVMELSDLEAEGRALYQDFNFTEAQAKFVELARRAPEKQPQMDYLVMLCLYGQGRDAEALAKARELSEKAPDETVRAEATLWLAKYSYNVREWKTARERFAAYAERLAPASPRAPSALVWAARAAFAAGDYAEVIPLVVKLTKDYPESGERTAAWLIQGEALSQLARLDEAIQVFEKVILAADATPEDSFRARRLKADVLFVMGADNPARYGEALAGYRALLLGESQNPDDRIDISYKIGHTLEKLGKMDEAIDQYYSQVVLAFREGQKAHAYADRTKGTFARAAFRLADEFERRGEDKRAEKVLKLVASSGITTAGAEVKRRLTRLKEKGNVK